MTGSEFDGAVRAIQARAEEIVAKARDELIKDITTLTDAMEGRAEVLHRHERMSDLVASSAYFAAVPITMNEAAGIDYVRDTNNHCHGVDCTLRDRRSEGVKVPAGEYILVVALVKRAKS